MASGVDPEVKMVLSAQTLTRAVAVEALPRTSAAPNSADPRPMIVKPAFGE